VLLPECSSGRIIHDEKRRPVLYRKIVDRHDLRVLQSCKRLSLCKEFGRLLVGQLGSVDFEGRVIFQIEMLTQIDIGLTASSKQAYQTIIAQLLSDTVSHHGLLKVGLRAIETPFFRERFSPLADIRLDGC
jgi:hypothetical protein